MTIKIMYIKHLWVWFLMHREVSVKAGDGVDPDDGNETVTQLSPCVCLLTDYLGYVLHILICAYKSHHPSPHPVHPHHPSRPVIKENDETRIIL